VFKGLNYFFDGNIWASVFY